VSRWDELVLAPRRLAFARWMVSHGHLSDWPDGEPPTRPTPPASRPVRLVVPSPERSPAGVRRWWR
jgi:hypothetical protein